METLSLIVPCYNEESAIRSFYENTKEVLKDFPMIVEYIFINDGSKDNTLSIIKSIHSTDENVHYVSFSRNFGKEAAIFAGLRESSGDACVVIDADLQHPPKTIYDMYELWKQGYQVVEGIKAKRGKESFPHRLMAGSFYKMISRFMGIDMNDSSDFKLIDRTVVNVLCSLKERNTFFRALSFWVGFKSTTVTYEVQERISGNTKWSPIKLVKYACSNLTAFTYAPLYMIIAIGFFFGLGGIVLAIDAIIDFFMGTTVDGYPTLIIVQLLSTGCILFSVGIIGVYIAKIYDEIKQRPQYIVSERE